MRRPSVAALVVVAVLTAGFVVECVWFIDGTDLCAFAGAHATSVWLTGLSWFFAVDGFLWNSMVLARGRRQPLRACCSVEPGQRGYGIVEVRVGTVYYATLCAIQLSATICYGASLRDEALVWSAVLAGILLVNAALAWRYARFLAAAHADHDDDDDDEEEGMSAHMADLVSGMDSIDTDASPTRGDKQVPLLPHASSSSSAPKSRLETMAARRRCGDRCCSCFRTTTAVVAFLFVALLFNGAAYEAIMYARNPPNGTFVTITHNRTPSGCTVTQHILTQCVSPVSEVGACVA